MDDPLPNTAFILGVSINRKPSEHPWCTCPAMAQKTLRVKSANGDLVSVVDTTVREILRWIPRCHKDDAQDCEVILIRGVTLLKPDMTVREAGLEDGDDISLVWKDPFIEMARCTGQAQIY